MITLAVALAIASLIMSGTGLWLILKVEKGEE